MKVNTWLEAEVDSAFIIILQVRYKRNNIRREEGKVCHLQVGESAGSLTMM